MKPKRLSSRFCPYGLKSSESGQWGCNPEAAQTKAEQNTEVFGSLSVIQAVSLEIVLPSYVECDSLFYIKTSDTYCLFKNEAVKGLSRLRT